MNQIRHRSCAWCSVWLLLLAPLAPRICAQNIVLNEIMYHPASHDAREEFVELFNRDGTNVNLTGWRLSKGVDFSFPSNTVIQAGGYLVVAAHLPTFTSKYPGVLNVVGSFLVVRTTNYRTSVLTNYENTLSNTRNEVRIENAAGDTINAVIYADEGEWAQRRRGALDAGYRGWTWYAEHDGLGKSLELINPSLPNVHGQNWTSSAVTNGTPGQPNSVASTNVAPLIVEAAHSPPVPRSTETVRITARILNETASGLTVTVNWNLGSFNTATPMFDDGLHGDGVAGDGLYGGEIPPQANDEIVSFYIQAVDGEGNLRYWPTPALPPPDNGCCLSLAAAALYQVDDSPLNEFGGGTSRQPVYKIIMTAAEANELQTMPCNVPGPIVCGTSDAQMNATFITLDGTQPEVHYFAGIKRRGHGSITANPRNYRLNFPSDHPWRDASGLVLNTRQVHMQHLGAVIANQAGAAGAYTRAVQVRVNNVNMAESLGQMFGSYAAKEVYEGDWAKNHFPLDDGGSIYQVVRDLDPSNFNYRGTNPNSYTNTYFKETNGSENDWTDLITMLSVMGENAGPEFTEANARQVVNVEQWLTHVAVMNLMGNAESGLNSGNNDDYYFYRGVNDPRFVLLYHDLDSIFTTGTSTGSDIFRSTQNNGSGAAFAQFLFSPGIQPLYYATLQRLLNTTFSQPQFDALVDQALGDYVASGTISGIKTWMNARRISVQSQIAGLVPPATNNPIATIIGEPRSPSPGRNATLTVGGDSIVSYRYKLNNGAYSGETPVGTPISLLSLPQGSTNTVFVVGKNSGGIFQSTASPTISKTWVVNTNTPTVRLNEVLAQNVSALNHAGTFPDAIELLNEGGTAVNIGGFGLTDDPVQPTKFAIPANTIIPAGGYLVVFANNVDGTPGLHTGFGLSASGESLYLFSTNGTAVDSVVFGMQLPDLSIGRTDASGGWRLCTPTFGALNSPRATGDPRQLRINEWLASGAPPIGYDFVELYNPTALPVDFGGCYLTDRPLGTPTLSQITPLSFIHSNSFAALIADGDPDAGADHLDFSLSIDYGEIALFDPLLFLIDSVIYGPQVPSVSQGRCGNGAANFASLVAPTPGAGNLCPPPPPPATTLLNYSHQWRYFATGTNWGTAWRATNFNDSFWTLGNGLLGFSTAPGSIPESILTSLPVSITRTTYYFRTTFVLPPGTISASFTHVIDDGAVFYLNGQELSPRFNMPGSAVTVHTFASSAIANAAYGGPINLPLGSLLPGTNWLAVEVHQVNTTSSDIIFGLKLDVVTNSASSAGVIINEILANNSNIFETNGSAPDWIELFNPSAAAVDLGGASLTDNVTLPQRWVFPSGFIVPAGGYRRVFFSANDPVSTTNTGFGLNDAGDSLYLFSGGGNLLDTVTFGLQAVDYSIGRLPGSSTWILTVPTPGTFNVAASLGDVSEVKVNEWMASPASGEDWFELFNRDAAPVAVGDHWLSDVLTTPATRMKYQLPKLSFLGVGAYAHRLFWADDVAVNSPEHVNFKLGGGGDSIGFSQPNGTQIEGMTFGAQTIGVSQGRLPDGAANIVSFPISQSPGDMNWLPLTNVVISEVLTHTDPPLEDAIEIQNLGPTSTNIGGWYLSDSKNDLKRYPIVGGVSFPAGGFRVFYETQFNNTSIPATAFALSSSKGDEVYLSAATNGVLTGYRAQVSFGAAQNGVSFGRHRRSDGQFDFVAMSARTFGVDSPATVAQFRTGGGKTNAYPLVGPVVISEIMYHPPDLGTNDNTRDEFIEFKNITGGPVNLFDAAFPSNRWRLRGGVDFDFPSNTTLAANGMLVVVGFNPTNTTLLNEFKTVYGTTSAVTILGPWSGQLANSSEEIELRRPDVPQQPPAADAGFVPYIVIERVVYADLPPWPAVADGTGWSLQRVSNTGYGNDATNWVGAPPTLNIATGNGDTDGDGMPDAYESQFPLALSPFNPNDGALDYDDDGMTNFQEFLAGTNPQSAASRLLIFGAFESPGRIRLQFNAVSNVAYDFQSRASLSTGGWLNLVSVPAAPSNRTVAITNTAAPMKFYRVVVP